MSELTPEERVIKIEGDYDKALRLIDRISEPRRQKILDMLEEMGERFCMAPASFKTEYHNCFPVACLTIVLGFARICLSLSKHFTMESFQRRQLYLCRFFMI